MKHFNGAHTLHGNTLLYQKHTRKHTNQSDDIGNSIRFFINLGRKCIVVRKPLLQWWQQNWIFNNLPVELPCGCLKICTVMLTILHATMITLWKTFHYNCICFWPALIFCSDQMAEAWTVFGEEAFSAWRRQTCQKSILPSIIWRKGKDRRGLRLKWWYDSAVCITNQQ